jgi:SAM-dependent methyltransferase
MNEAVALCLAGAISPQVALSRMLLGGADANGIAAAVAQARPRPPTAAWLALAGLLDGRAEELERLAEEIRHTGSDHSAMGGVAGIAAFFDRAVATSAEAGVALYSLGDPAILAAATDEIVDWLLAERLLPAGAVLDIGCGIGRIAAAVAPLCVSVVGLDVSPGMVAEAQRRHGARPELRFAVTDGRSVPADPVDRALLVDSMPYVHQAGLADGIVAGVAAALRPGGALVVLNLSYGRDAAADRADATRWAAAHGLALAISRPFKLWDATAFVLRRSGAAQ